METRIKSKPATLLRSPQSLRLPLHLSKAAGIRKQGGSAHQYVRGKNVAKVMDTKPTTSRNRSLHLDRLYRLAVKEQEWKSFMFTTNCSVVPLNYFGEVCKPDGVIFPCLLYFGFNFFLSCFGNWKFCFA